MNAYMVGYLAKRSESWFKSWTEKFCVLTNVGLLYYDDPQKRPKNLFPTIEADILPLAEGVYDKKYVFKMKTFAFEITFAAPSRDQYERWIRGFEKLRRETEKRKTNMLDDKRIKANNER